MSKLLAECLRRCWHTIEWGDRAGAVEVTPFSTPFDLDQSFRWHRRIMLTRREPREPSDANRHHRGRAYRRCFSHFAATLYWADLHTGGLSK